jgi:CHAD domain-containing protein
MIKDLIINFVNEQIKNLAASSNKSVLDQNEENLHELRVACKKLKAMYQVLSGITGGLFDAKNHFEEINKLFKTVGALRDFHVQQQLMEKVTTENSIVLSEKFLTQFNEKRTETSQSVKLALTEFEGDKMTESLENASLLIENLKDKSILKNIIRLLKLRLKQIQKLLPVKKDEDKIHLMRKRVKQVCYIVDLIKVIDPDKNHFKHNDRFKEAAELLGNWHDYVILANLAGNYLYDNIDDDAILELYIYLKVDEKVYLKKARKKLKKYFS